MLFLMSGKSRICQKLHTKFADVAGNCSVIVIMLRTHTTTTIAQVRLRFDVYCFIHFARCVSGDTGDGPASRWTITSAKRVVRVSYCFNASSPGEARSLRRQAVPTGSQSVCRSHLASTCCRTLLFNSYFDHRGLA